MIRIEDINLIQVLVLRLRQLHHLLLKESRHYQVISQFPPQ